MVEGCGHKNATVFDDGCYQKFKSQFVDNIAIIGGEKAIFFTP